MAYRSSRSQHNTPKHSKPLKDRIAELQKTSILQENNVNLYAPKGSPLHVFNQTPGSPKCNQDFLSLLQSTELSDKDETISNKLNYTPFECESLNQTSSPNFDKLAFWILSPETKITLPKHDIQVSYSDTVTQISRKDTKCRLKSRNGAYRPSGSFIDNQEITKGSISPKASRIDILNKPDENDAMLWNKVNTLLETHGFSPLILTESQQPEFNSLSDTFITVVSEFSKLHRKVVSMTNDRSSSEYTTCLSSTRISDTSKSTQNTKTQDRSRNFVISKEEKIFESFLKRRFDPENFMDSHIMAIITFYEEKLKLKETDLTSLRDQTQSEFRASIASFSGFPLRTESLSTENTTLKQEISHLKSELHKVMEYKNEVDKSFSDLPLISDVVIYM